VWAELAAAGWPACLAEAAGAAGGLVDWSWARESSKNALAIGSKT